MCSIVLTWYPGGHVVLKMQGRYLYLQDWHGEGSQREKKKKKKKHKAKNTKTATLSKSTARKQAQKEIYFWRFCNIVNL